MRSVLKIIILAAISLSGCNGTNQNQNVNSNSNNANGNANKFTAYDPPKAIKPESMVDPNFKPCNPYFPLLPGSLTRYTVTYATGLIADATVVVDSVEENGRKIFRETTQIVDRTGGSQKAETTVRKYVCEGERIQIVSESTDNKIEDKRFKTEFKFRDPAIAFENLQSLNRVGSTWTYSLRYTIETADAAPVSPDEPVIVTFKAMGPEMLTTKIGKFNTMKVERAVKDNKITDYFVRGLGLVKRQSAEGTAWELREYSGLTPAE
jgi:hypothetical protein